MKTDGYEIKSIEIEDQEYPEHLRLIEDPPKTLYYIGDISLIRFPLIGIVGTRRCSQYGWWASNEIAKKVAGCGISVVSGMAEGIDSAAHWGCISKSVPTVAVFGTGVDVCFPSSNSKLYTRILQDGLVLSEYEPGTKGYKRNFPARNRIISGLSKSVIVVEGVLKSGSMITARLAAEQGRDLFAVPGNINQPGSMGVNKLIADGAYPVLDIDSVPNLLGIGETRKMKQIKGLSDDEKLVLAQIIENPGTNAEYIAFRTGLDISKVTVIASGLELKSLVFSKEQNFYTEK